MMGEGLRLQSTESGLPLRKHARWKCWAARRLLPEDDGWGIQGSEHCSYKVQSAFSQAICHRQLSVILGPKRDSGIVAIIDGP